MTREGIVNLIQTICIHYPSYRKNIETADGQIVPRVIDEWYRLIGYIDHKEAVARLDEYLKLPEGNKFAPDVKWFLGYKKKEEKHEVSQHNFDRIDKLGRLMDGEGRLYAFPNEADERYHYDSNGHIVNTKGRLVR